MPIMMYAQLPETNDQRLVLAHSDTEFAARVKRGLARLGWEVYLVRTGDGARRFARELIPSLVVLDTDLPDESGWLVCKKLTCEQPDLRVILVTDRRGCELPRFARFVGAAALTYRQDGFAALSHEVLALEPSVRH
jgi:DNA-binding NtrC family response regulator